MWPCLQHGQQPELKLLSSGSFSVCKLPGIKARREGPSVFLIVWGNFVVSTDQGFANKDLQHPRHHLLPILITFRTTDLVFVTITRQMSKWLDHRWARASLILSQMRGSVSPNMNIAQDQGHGFREMPASDVKLSSYRFVNHRWTDLKSVRFLQKQNFQNLFLLEK